MSTNNNDDVIGRECIFARYSKAKDGSNNDILLVKERVHYTDGRKEPNLRIIRNMKRDFYITKPGCRNYEQKKEWTDEKNLNRYECTQAELADKIAQVLKVRPGKPLTHICRSPYVYGADIRTDNLIKQRYREKWPDLTSEDTVASLDIETDVLSGDESIIMCTVSFKDKVHTVVRKDFASRHPLFEKRVHKQFEKYLGKYKTERNIDLQLEIVDRDIDVLTRAIDTCHEWMPDYVAVWNLKFEIGKFLSTLKKYNIDPAAVFSHPKLPPEYRRWNWTEKKAKKESAGGKVVNKHPAELWHTTDHPAGFHFIDAMALFCQMRVAAGKRASYGLDAILHEELGLNKLKIDEVEGLEGLEFHEVMQASYPAEYVVYNIFDCIGVELLDEKNGDMSRALRPLLAESTINQFASQPRRLANGLHFFCKEHGKVIGTTSDEMITEDDKYLLSMNNWIVTLAAHLRAEGTGLRLLEEAPYIETEMYGHVADLDITSSYPTTEIILNVSKETTHRELSRIKGLSEGRQRKLGLNMTAAPTNAVELCNEAFGLPRLDTLLEAFKEDIGTA